MTLRTENDRSPMLDLGFKGEQVTDNLLGQAPDRLDAISRAKNVSYSKTTLYTSATLGRIGKMAISHAADTV